MCCPGCEAVAQAIIDNGLSSFYQKRTAYAPSSLALPDELKSYDHDQLNAVPLPSKDKVIESSLIIEGITCSACIWLLEKHVRQLSGVLSFKINYATRRAQLKIDRNTVRLIEVLAAIQSIGYRALPYDASKQFSALQKERKDFLARIGVAVFCSMQTLRCCFF